MIYDQQWEVRFENNIPFMAEIIYVYRREGQNTVYLTEGGAVQKTLTRDELIKITNPADIAFAFIREDGVLSKLIEVLDAKGIKAPTRSFAEGELQATKAHLDDMRSYFYKKEKLAEPHVDIAMLDPKELR